MLIRDDLVVATARGVGAPRPGATGAAAERLLRDQPEVLAFVLAGTAQLGLEARALGVFLADVVQQIFARAGRTATPLAPRRFVEALRGNRDMAVKIGQAHDRFAERYLRCSQALRQPAVIRYLTGVLLEPGAAGPRAVGRDDLGPLFLVLKSVVDVLDGPPGQGPGGRAPGAPPPAAV